MTDGLVKSPYWYFKKGWLFGLGQEVVAWWWGNCLKYLKRGWNRKEGRGNKYFKKGRKLGQGVSALKRGEVGTPLRTMLYVSYRGLLHVIHKLSFCAALGDSTETGDFSWFLGCQSCSIKNCFWCFVSFFPNIYMICNIL